MDRAWSNSVWKVMISAVPNNIRPFAVITTDYSLRNQMINQSLKNLRVVREFAITVSDGVSGFLKIWPKQPSMSGCQ